MNTNRETGREASLAGDLRHIVQVLRGKALLIALCTVVATALGIFYAWRSPKIYAAKSTIQIEQEEQTVVKVEGVKTEDLKAPEVLKTYEQNVVSPEVLLRVIQRIGGPATPPFLPEVAGARTDNALQEALNRRITAKIRRDTRLIDITVEDRSPALAQRIAEVLVAEFTRWNSDTRREADRTASLFLHAQAAHLSEKLAQSELALQAFKESHGDVSFQDRQNISVEKINQLSTRVTEAKAERLKLESDGTRHGVAAGQSLGEMLSIPGIAGDPVVVEFQKKISEKEAAFANLTQRYRAGHPSLAAAQSELDTLRTGLDDAILRAAGVLAAHLKAAKLNEQKLEEALREQQKAALGTDAVAIGYSTLAREVESNRALYEAVVARMKETDITKEIGQDTVRLVARPLLPDLPVKPKVTVILALSLVAGLGLGCFLAFASHAADPSLKTMQDAEARLGLRSLSEIPRIRPGKGGAGGVPVLGDSASVALEAFRTLRTSLTLLGDDPEKKTILFTSAHAGEGKTFCATNCAVSFAQLGLSTLLIDADFRMPQSASLLLGGSAVQGREPGGANGTLHGAIRPTHIPKLFVLSPNDAGPDSPEFLAGESFLQIIRQARTKFDRIVVDSAPVLPVSDTLLFARHVDSVCMVIHAGRTPAGDVLRAVRRLAEADAPPVGFVWNQVKPGDAEYSQYGRAGSYGANIRRIA